VLTEYWHNEHHTGAAQVFHARPLAFNDFKLAMQTVRPSIDRSKEYYLQTQGLRNDGSAAASRRLSSEGASPSNGGTGGLAGASAASAMQLLQALVSMGLQTTSTGTAQPRLPARGLGASVADGVVGGSSKSAGAVARTCGGDDRLRPLRELSDALQHLLQLAEASTVAHSADGAQGTNNGQT